MATIIKIVYDVTNPVIKVTYDVTNITVSGSDIAPVYISLDYSSSSAVTVITSVGLTMPTGFSVANSPLTSSGTLAVTYASGYSLPTTTKQGEWDQAYNDKINSAAVTGTTTKTLTLNQQDGGTIQASWSDIDTGLTSVGLSVPTGLTVTNSPLTTNGTIAVGLASGYSIPTTASQSTWDAAYNDKINSAAVTGTTTKTLTLNQQDGGTVTASWTDDNTDAVTSVFGRTGTIVATEGDYTLTQLGDVTLTSPTTGQVLKYNGTTWVNNTDTDTGLTSVGLSMPSAFAVSNSPLTSNGTIAVTGAGTSAQYVRGDGQLANFPTNGGGGSSVNYYLNGSVSQGTFGGDTYYEMSKSPIIGAGTNFTRTNAQGNGYIASFITDAGDPALLNIPGGNWNVEFYFQASSGGGNPSFYAELYKVSSANVFTLIASGSTNPEGITQGTVVDQYFTSIPVAQTALLATDRIAVRIFVTPSGRNITLHTENSNLCEVLTTFSTGLNALNGLTAQVQYFATGTSGTDFNIQSLTDTHTFNLPVASGSNTGKLSNTDWITFDGKENVLTFSAPLSRSVNTVSIPVATTSQPGYLDSTDWTTFNAKVTSVSATSPLFSTGGKTPTLTIQQASGSQNGYLSNTDWTTFNGKQNTITLTTTGTSGAATLIGSTLNIPQYSGTNIYNGDGTLTGNRSLTHGGYNLSFIGSTHTNRFTAAGRLLLGTTTESTYLLDVNGTARVSGNATFSGNVGINTTSLAVPFTVRGTTDRNFEVSGGGGILLISSLDNARILYKNFGIDGSALFLQSQSGGNVGIGNTNPAYKLDVSGTGNFTGALSGTSATFNGNIGIGLSPIITSGGAFSQIFIGGSGQGGVIYGQNNAGSIALLANAYYNASNVVIYINSVDRVGQIYNYNGEFIFSNAPVGTSGNTVTLTPRLTIASTGAATFSSSVTASSFIKSGGTSSQYLMADGSTSTLTNPVTGTGTTNYLPKWTSGSAIGNSNLINDASGNLGLGVTPSAWSRGTAIEVGALGSAFHGYSDLVSISENTYFNSGWKYGNTRAATQYILSGGVHYWFNAPSGTAGNAISFTQAMTLDASGNLGIGAAIPSQRLHLNIASGAIYTRIQNNLNSLYLGLESGGIAQVSSDVSSLKVMASTYTSFETGGAERMRLTANGRLLLGTTTEGSERLQVNGTMILKGVSYPSIAFDSDATSVTWSLYSASSSDYFAIYNGTTDVLKFASTGAATFSSSVTATSFNGTTNNIFSVGGTETMRISGAFNLLVGTTTDTSERLQINGKIKATDTITTSNTVFGKDFQATTSTAANPGFLTNINTGIFNAGTNAIGFSTASTERVRIKSTGAVRYIPMATPASAEAGDVYYDSTSNKLRCYNGTSWNDLF